MEGTIRQGARITALAFIGPEGGATVLTDMPFDMVARIYEDIKDDDIGNMNSALTGTTHSDVGDTFLRKACDRYLQQTDKIQDICETPKNLTQLKCKEKLGMCDRALYSLDQLIDEGQGVYRIPHGVEVVVKISDVLSDDRRRDIYEIIVPNTVTTIGFKAFAFCQRLGSINLPNSITVIEDGAFLLCDALTAINIPNSVTEIQSYAFASCIRLTTINIPNSVTKIGYAAFSFCERLTSITIPDSVTNIEAIAFWLCKRLTSIIIPDSVTKIGKNAFQSCKSLDDISLPGHFRNKPEMVQKAFEANDANVINKIKYR